MKKRGSILRRILPVITFLNLFVIINLNIAEAEEKHRALVLHIIEENWDDLEFAPPTYSNDDKGKISKKDMLKHFRDRGAFDHKEGKKVMGRIKKRRLKIPEERKSGYKNNIIRISNRKGINYRDTKLYINHNIFYYGKMYWLKEEDKFDMDILRLDHRIDYKYSFINIPEKISILIEPKNYFVNEKRFAPPTWRNFHEIRLVEDIYILSHDQEGNLKIKYNGQNYDLNTGHALELPAKETDLTKEEVFKYRERYYESYKMKYGGLTRFYGAQIRSSKKIFHFGTKVTVINYGYEEF